MTDRGKGPPPYTLNAAYVKAAAKIEAARAGGATELVLEPAADGSRLLALPESLYQLKTLKRLSLASAHLPTLPESLRLLSQLEYLNLTSCGIERMGDALRGMASLRALLISNNRLQSLPGYCSEWRSLRELFAHNNALTELPAELTRCRALEVLILHRNKLRSLPDAIGALRNLRELRLSENELMNLPDSIGNTGLQSLWVDRNHLVTLPPSLAECNLSYLESGKNPLSYELRAAIELGFPSLKTYLKAQKLEHAPLFEAKLILVGEGEVGKTCLLDALCERPWKEHSSTHGIQVQPMKISAPGAPGLSLNCWDFGGQRVYRPTHQLFFSAPAIYLVVWKPREGAQQNLVKEWIRLILHRAPAAKIFVVGTHGGPDERQPDIDRQELWDLFGRDTVLDFFHVENKPDSQRHRRGVPELREAIGRAALELPDVRRVAPLKWRGARQRLLHRGAPYLSVETVRKICRGFAMSDEEIALFLAISHRLGHLIHYEHDLALRDLVILKPDWLATAISFVLDDKVTRDSRGLVSFTRLSQLWNDPRRPEAVRYAPDLHPLFLRLMERFDISYKVVLAGEPIDSLSFSQQVKLQAASHVSHAVIDARPLAYTSLIAQLVPDVRPMVDLQQVWPDASLQSGDQQQQQICRIVDGKGTPALAEGLFYQLIVRLHKYSLGRVNFAHSVHWQRGLVVDDSYNGRALLEYVDSNVRITVRAAYPERLLAMLTSEVKYLVESYWTGLECEVMVPCVHPCGRGAAGTGLFRVDPLLASKRGGRSEFPCPTCGMWQQIDHLLRNALPAAPVPADLQGARIVQELRDIRQLLTAHHGALIARVSELTAGQRELLSRADSCYAAIVRSLTDEAVNGPRLISVAPVERSKFHPRQWLSAKFRITLWCEHSRLPTHFLGGDERVGVYEIELDRAWFKTVAPYLKVMNTALRLVLPVAVSGAPLLIEEARYKELEHQLDFSKEVIDATLGAGELLDETAAESERWLQGPGAVVVADGAGLREFHALLRRVDPAANYGGLVRVLSKRQEFRWVHPQFKKEY
ncbi:COR domain-containing protein [Peristeroidobacter soli]|uniref:COR domain-containing protein n=1 Tax=Peristeroidobacter soli TaxID=2497877 RepID=UPI00101BE91F|nr:COR domain-containing protein [Peristeroidobacter soli]